jgi:hypothetical protein
MMALGGLYAAVMSRALDLGAAAPRRDGAS